MYCIPHDLCFEGDTLSPIPSLRLPTWQSHSGSAVFSIQFGIQFGILHCLVVTCLYVWDIPLYRHSWLFSTLHLFVLTWRRGKGWLWWLQPLKPAAWSLSLLRYRRDASLLKGLASFPRLDDWTWLRLRGRRSFYILYSFSLCACFDGWDFNYTFITSEYPFLS